ncbi:unnamed protein product [Adineta ricciae]|uniref:Uncharacterized protein n=1 Tax=Adineta ricciae TaxID=249248 RepID=A0A815ICU0_ADIRI|nr:unnamed protein product [Adineta ricciae]CAF1364174.1 unnamed protein product [Adineta ricciae]
MIQSTINSVVVLIETCYLPDPRIMQHHLQQQQQQQRNNNMGTIIQVNFTTSIQQWKDGWVTSESMKIDTSGDELIVDVDDDAQQKPKLNPPLGLHTAVAETFNKFLDKSYTKNDWNCGLDRDLGTWRRKRFSTYEYNECEEKQQREDMKRYAIYDCVVVAEVYFEKYPETANDYAATLQTPTTPEIPITTTTNSLTRQPDEVLISNEPETSVEIDSGTSTKREIMLNRPELLNKMNENELLDFLRPTLNHQSQKPQRTPEEELQKKKERQKK